MKKWILFSVSFFLMIFFMTDCAFAAAILSIVPSSTAAITIPSSGTTSLSYTVTNNSSKSVSDLYITPDFNATALLTGSVSSNGCTGSLAAGASCTFTDNITGGGSAGAIRLMPRVCVFNGLNCSVPVLANRVTVTTKTLQSIAITPTTPTTLRRTATVQYAATGTYTDSATQDITTNITWSSSNTSVATIGASTGAMTGVGVGSTNITAASGSVTSNTVALTLQDFAYIANVINNTVSYCAINSSDGTFGTCTAVTNAGAGNNTFSSPVGVSINPAHTRLYIVNQTNTVSNCTLNTNGSLGSCSTISDSSFNSPLGNAIHPNGNFAYIANEIPGAGVSICPVNASGGFGTCSTKTVGSNPHFRSVGISPSGAYAYLTDIDNNAVYSCDVNATTGALSNCSTNSSFTDLLGITVHPNGNFAYLVNGGSITAPVTRCTLNTSTGVFSSCAAQSITLANLAASFIAFNPADSTKMYVTVSDLSGYDRVILATVNATTGNITASQLLSDSTFNGIIGIALD